MLSKASRIVESRITWMEGLAAILSSIQVVQVLCLPHRYLLIALQGHLVIPLSLLLHLPPCLCSSCSFSPECHLAQSGSFLLVFWDLVQCLLIHSRTTSTVPPSSAGPPNCLCVCLLSGSLLPLLMPTVDSPHGSSRDWQRLSPSTNFSQTPFSPVFN